MKQLFKILALVLVLILAITALVACNEDAPPAGGGEGEGTNGEGEGGGGEQVDPNAEFTVTFKYIDKQGNEMKDSGGYADKKHSGIKYDGNARNTNTESITAFADYVIIGWNADKAAAMAGTVDENCVKNIKADATLYSVVREKVMKTVTFQNSQGTVIGTAQIREGEAIGDAIARPSEMGLVFREWKFVSNDEAGKRDSKVDCIYGNCTFKAVMGAADGVIGMVEAGAIKLDGKRDDLYNTKGAYLAHAIQASADGSKFEEDGGSRFNPDSKVDTYAVWDGDYVYLIVEVWDKHLTRRSDAYLATGLDAWCNDAVEIWYTFEQDMTITRNETRVGFGSTGDNLEEGVSAKFALARKQGIFGGRSTHYEKIEMAVRNTAMGKRGDDLDVAGITAPSYIMEIKLPAYTEGAADMTKAVDDKGNPLKDEALAEFIKTGRLYGVDPNNNAIENYAFTEGEKLVAGDMIRLSVQVDDLKFSVEKLKGYFDTITLEEAQKLDPTLTALPSSSAKLYELVDGKLVGVSHAYNFTATGATQRDVSLYLWFVLGDENAKPEWKVHSWKKNLATYTKPIMLDENGQPYERAQVVE